MPNDAPIPAYSSPRLIGPEIEVDAGHTELRVPTRVDGWSRKTDGSLGNGYEFVLEPPLTLDQFLPICRNFDRVLNEHRTNIGTAGGFHVHVQVHDYSVDDAVKLVNLYTHFQPVIDKLCGASRRNNRWAPPYRDLQTAASLTQMFSLGRSAGTRQEAKGSRCYSTVNLAMMRCRDERQRTVEFRQQSSSKRTECIYGWASLMVALVDLAKESDADMVSCMLDTTATVANFSEIFQDFQASKDATGVAEWILWRHAYLNDRPTDEQINAVISAASRRPIGVHGIARLLDTNVALARRIVDGCGGKLVRVSVGNQTKYRSDYALTAAADLDALRRYDQSMTR